MTTLNYDRISTSITDTKTSLNIDDQLPSNTKLNKFIGSLPKTEKNYSIAYSEFDQKITIKLAGQSETFKKEALDVVRSALDDSFVTDNNISIFYPSLSSTSEDARATFVQTYIDPNYIN